MLPQREVESGGPLEIVQLQRHQPMTGQVSAADWQAKLIFGFLGSWLLDRPDRPQAVGEDRRAKRPQVSPRSGSVRVALGDEDGDATGRGDRLQPGENLPDDRRRIPRARQPIE
jgi:hypothetical protein